LTVVYLDTSALGRVLLGEPDTPAILRAVGAYEQRVASRLLRIELRRLALRAGPYPNPERLLSDADQLLAGVALLPVDEAILSAAETVPPVAVASLDAIHLVTAVRVAHTDRLDAVMTYDAQLAEAAEHHGLTVIVPR